VAEIVDAKIMFFLLYCKHFDFFSIKTKNLYLYYHFCNEPKIVVEYTKQIVLKKKKQLK